MLNHLQPESVDQRLSGLDGSFERTGVDRVDLLLCEPRTEHLRLLGSDFIERRVRRAVGALHTQRPSMTYEQQLHELQGRSRYR